MEEYRPMMADPEPETVQAAEPLEIESDHPELQKKELTERDIRKLRAMYFTVRRPTVNVCGHKINIEAQPNNNCEYCWFTFFQNHGELVQTADEVFQKHGPETLDRTRGVKFRKMFLRFMATVAQFTQQMQEVPNGENNNKEAEEAETRS